MPASRHSCPSSDVVAELRLLLASGAEDELSAFLARHRGALSLVLGMDESALQERALAGSDERRVKLSELISRTRREERDCQRERRTNLALGAVGMLNGLARWEEDRIGLDPGILLGQSLVPPWARYVCLAPEGRRAVTVSATPLRRAGRVLRKRGDLRAYLDDLGLTFEWKGGRGRLRFRFRLPIPREHLPRVFRIELSAPVPAKRSAGAWLGEVLREVRIA